MRATRIVSRGFFFTSLGVRGGFGLGGSLSLGGGGGGFGFGARGVLGGALGAKRVHLNLVTRLTLALGDETRLKTRLFTDETAQVEQLGATNLIDWQKKETRASVDGSRARGAPVDETRAHHRERTTPQTRETNTRIKT